MRRSLAVVALATLAGAVTIAGFSVVAKSADHQDAPGVKANPTSDINDVFSWMDGSNVVLAMTSNPGATSSTLFDNTIQYVFHTGSTLVFTGAVPTTSLDVIVTFSGTAAPQTFQAWVGTTDYVTGPTGGTTGTTSASGKVKVWAGPVADPFFFNLDGFHSVVQDVVAAEPSLLSGGAFNEAGCPTLGTTTSNFLVSQLALNPQGGAPANHFATLDGMGIVVEVDKSLLNTTSGASLVSVWGATYSPPTSANARG
jgi:hypothetical protein